MKWPWLWKAMSKVYYESNSDSKDEKTSDYWSPYHSEHCWIHLKMLSNDSAFHSASNNEPAEMCPNSQTQRDPWESLPRGCCSHPPHRAMCAVAVFGLTRSDLEGAGRVFGVLHIELGVLLVSIAMYVDS